MQPVDLCLQGVAPLLVLRELRARIGELRLRSVALLLGVRTTSRNERISFSRPMTPACSPSRLTRSHSRPIQTPSRVITDSPLSSVRRFSQRFGQRVDGDDAGQQR